ncbi:hypothetical protein DFH09DRAFT_97674 [Mycena vulgaris]|nr:hypothetical protein DFH09DRAFT_97674 [Mycena vulgaris]
MDAAGLEPLIVALHNVAVTRYVSAAGYVALLYDHVLTFDDEVEYVWSAPNTLAKILFLMLRYMVPLSLSVQIITRSGIPVIPMSNTVCKGWIAFATYSGWLSIAISNFLVLLRIWTTLPRGHRLIAWSLAFFVVTQLTSFGVTSWVIVEMIRVFVYSPIGLCTFTAKPDVVGLWVVGLAFEVVVFITVCWNTLDRPRALSPGTDVAVTRILFRDGVVYFVMLFIFRIANAAIAVVAPVSSIFVIVFFIWAATTITTTRLIINSRRVGGKAAQLQALAAAAAEGDFTSETVTPDDTRMRGSLSGSHSRRSRSMSLRV